MRSDEAALPVGTKELVGMGEGADAPLRLADLARGVSGVQTIAERDRMGQRMIADPMARRMRLSHQRRRLGIVEFLADDEERRPQARSVEDIEHPVGG